MELVEPSVLYKESFIEAMGEYQELETGDRRRTYDLEMAQLQYGFPSYVSRLLEESKGKHLPEGYVPQTTYWLVEGEEFIGRVSIRHSLTKKLMNDGGHIGFDIRPTMRKKGNGKKILELALPLAKYFDLEKVLITCNENNTASRKIIEANGGVLENIVKQPGGKPSKMRYWIQVKENA